MVNRWQLRRRRWWWRGRACFGRLGSKYYPNTDKQYFTLSKVIGCDIAGCPLGEEEKIIIIIILNVPIRTSDYSRMVSTLMCSYLMCTCKSATHTRMSLKVHALQRMGYAEKSGLRPRRSISPRQWGCRFG